MKLEIPCLKRAICEQVGNMNLKGVLENLCIEQNKL